MKTQRRKKQNLKQITILLPEVLIKYYKEKAANLGIGYRTLIRLKLMEDFLKETGEEIKRARGKPEGAEVELQGRGKLLSEMVIEDRR